MPGKHRGRPATDNSKSMRVDVRLTEEEWNMASSYFDKELSRLFKRGYVF